MATLVLATAGAAIGAGFGGTVLGLSGAVIGRAVGAVLGQAIDQRLMGSGSTVVETGRIERLRMMGASEGAAVGQVFGRTRVSGQVIWASQFKETVSTTESGGGGKGGSSQASTTVESYSYSVSLAVALCEGTILRVGRIWADGNEIARNTIIMRVYVGSEGQLPDALISAVEGADLAPAYRGIAYVVIEDLQLGAYGNRVPQLSFEVVRAAQGDVAKETTDLTRAIRSVALMPGTGEYALATSAVHYSEGPGVNRTANMNFPSGATDFSTSLQHLREELPNIRSVSLVVSWFGDDLRCGSCQVRPKVEQKLRDGVTMPWRAGGITRGAAQTVPYIDGRPVYGGTPADKSVIEAIQAIRAAGQEVMFYPFLLMEQLSGNALPDPWSGSIGQPVLPWRGRITTSRAPGTAGTPDRTAGAAAEVAAFFGAAQPSDFTRTGGAVSYSGPAEWGYRRFILHYAHLCVAAGGVDSFCVGSELRSLTQIRAVGDSFPAVTALRQLATDVRGILGPSVKISYAADWSEYFGYDAGPGTHYFHLDALWADPAIDFIGIDNYMPISDWRDGEHHADKGWGSIYNLDYLKANIAGGEGFDWYYPSQEDAVAQRRLAIADGDHDEPWIYRYKDLKSWWSLPHHDRVAGVRKATPSAWVPRSKPIRFTELGCPAIDKGTNEPNKFVDPKSSESQVPRFSSGRRDDLIQMQYLRAQSEFWRASGNNPLSPVYSGRMVDVARAHVWAWDARPFPVFPNLSSAWSDGGNYARGHWLNGRATGQVLGSVVADLCEQAGVRDFGVSTLYGYLRGYSNNAVASARAVLQPLMLAYGFDTVERDGLLRFVLRNADVAATLHLGDLVRSDELDGIVETTRTAEAEMSGRVRLSFVEAEGAFATRQAEAVFPDDQDTSVSQSEIPLTLTLAEGRGIVERWLADARIARDGVRFALPRSRLSIGAGDVVQIEARRYRIDRIEQADHQLVEGSRVEAASLSLDDAVEETSTAPAQVAPVPVFPLFLDLPLLEGSEVPHAPHIAISATPWPGSVAVWSSASDAGYVLNRLISAPTTVGVTETVLPKARPGLVDRGPALRVRVYGGTLQSSEMLAVLNGANTAAIGDGNPAGWEVFQFTSAVLVAPDVYELTGRIRGQAGSEPEISPAWPAGSQVVFLRRGLDQLDLPLASRGLERNYRIGPALRGYDDPTVIVRREAFDGIGLRPYRPVHLSATRRTNGDVEIGWIRRSRIDGDGWHYGDAPLGEDREAYRVRVFVADAPVRVETTVASRWSYGLAARTQDGALGGCRIEVAQISDRFGPGPGAVIDLVA